MYDIEKLEQQWRRYRRNRLLIPIGVIAALSGAVLLFVFWPTGHSLTSRSKSQTVDIHKIPVVASTSTKDNASRPLSAEVPSVSDNSHRKKGLKMTFADSVSPNISNEKTTGKPEHHIDITVTKKKVTNTAEGIKKRFQATQDKEDALFLARYYYDKKQYKNALNWALETNKLDSNIEESWLLFGKSKAKIGQRMEAIRVLQSYYDRTGSAKARTLLGNIRRGKPF